MAIKEKPKIAFVHPDLGIGGAERLVLDAAGALSNANQVFFITNHFDRNHAFEELKNGDYEVRVIGDWIPRSVFGKFQALCAYIRMIYLTLVYVLFLRHKDNPDLFFVDLIPIAIPFLKLANLKVVYYCHHPDLLASSPGGWLKRLYRKPIDWLEYKATAKADVILVNSEYTASVFRKTFPHINKAIKILYPTIAASYQKTVQELNRPSDIHSIVEQIPAGGDKFIFLSINRFHPAKKLELAILAFKILRSRVNVATWRKIYLLIVGGFDPLSSVNANYYEKLTQLAAENFLLNKIVFIKSPSDKKKAELLLSCSCLLYTPVNEHFGIVPLEAMLVGKPVLACNSGGPRETVDHGLSGYLCEETPESMAEFMYRLVVENNLEEMGKNGYERLNEKFSYGSFSRNLNKVVNKIVEQ